MRPILSFSQNTRPIMPSADHWGSDYFARRRALSVDCTFDDADRLRRKVEDNWQERAEYEYGFDAAGHLAGALTSSSENGSVTYYTYDNDTLLDRVIMPDKLRLRRRPMLFKPGIEDPWGIPVGGTIHYEYDANSPNPQGPVRKFRNNCTAAEFVWQDAYRLKSATDYELGLKYVFYHGGRGTLDRIRLTGIPQSKVGPLLAPLRLPRSIFWNEGYDREPEPFANGLEPFFGRGMTSVTLLCGCDQVGTPKLFTRPDGTLVKRLEYDSFGVVIDDTFPEIFIPIGFAGGLYDRDTGLVRFGYRDYDPAIGRFLCPDPAKDRRGDGDIYDYCADDPVSRVDPSGLWTQATFDEGRVKRDEEGRFAGGESGGNTGNDSGFSVVRDNSVLAGTSATNWGTPQIPGAPLREIHGTPDGPHSEKNKPESRYYVVGNRPLDIPIGEELAKASEGVITHTHLIRNDGYNIGLTTTGTFSDKPEKYGQYTYADGKKYDAAIMDRAIAGVNAEWEKTEKVAQELGEDIESYVKRYSTPVNNCKHYVKDVIGRAEAIAKREGTRLVIN